MTQGKGTYSLDVLSARPFGIFVSFADLGLALSKILADQGPGEKQPHAVIAFVQIASRVCGIPLLPTIYYFSPKR